MTLPAVPPDDSERISLLQSTKLLDAEVPPAFEALARLLAATLNCPMAAVNLVDAYRVWSLAKVGLAYRQTSRPDSFCWTVVSQTSSLQVEDVSADVRFQALSAVTGTQGVKAYLGVPLMVEGRALGTICVFDHQPRRWQAQDRQHLADMAITAVALIEGQLRHERFRLMEARVRTASQAGNDWLWETNDQGELTWVSSGLLQHTGLDPASEIGLKGADLYAPREDDTRASWDRFAQARARREPFADAIGDRTTPRGRITVSISGTPVFNSRGLFKGYRGASRIVTRQIEAELEARRADQLLRQAIESFQISVMISDQQGHIVLANQRWKDQTRDVPGAMTQPWGATMRMLMDQGAYPDAIGREEDFMTWRLSARDRQVPQELRFQDRWLLIADNPLPNGFIVHFAMDITQNKRDAALLHAQQQALIDTKASLSAVLNALPDLWFVLDEHDRYVDGHAEHPMLLRPMSQLKGTSLGEHLPPQQAQLQQDALHRLQQTGLPQRFEYDLPMPDGVQRHFEARMAPMPDGHALFLTRDITERQLAAEKLRVSEELYRSVAATISDGLVIVELSGRVVALNHAASRILGVKPEELTNLTAPSLLGLTLLQEDLVTPLPVPQWPISETLAKGQRVVDRVNPLRRPDGEIVWVQTSCHLLRVDSDAPPFAAMATLRDITRERHAQQELQLSEERWKFALEGAGDGVWDWDLGTGHVYFSQRCKAMLGYEDDQVLDTIIAFFDHIHPTDRELVSRCLEDYVKQTEGIHQAEFRLQHKHGHYLSILSRGKVVSRDRDGVAQRVVGTHSDITLLKQAEKALRDKQSAEMASAAKSEFLSRMSHEIRTPLNAVNGFAQLLQLQLTQQSASDHALNYVAQILHASHHLMGLVNDVLDLQQVEAGVLRFKPEPLSLNEEVTQCLAMLAPLADKRGITLHNGLSAHLPMIADRQRLRQVIMNVGSNAIKYNQPAGSVRIGSERLSDQALALTIEDTGPGMSPQQLSKLFQPFERLGRETSNIEGTGLGLIITRSLIEAMGGRMEIRSQPGLGTRISIILPMAAQAEFEDSQSPAEPTTSPLTNQTHTEATPPADDAHTPAPLRVLYVEDNRINAMLFEEALRPFPQINLALAEDGQMALEMAQDNAPDVLVLDAHLPGMSGFEVLRALRALPELATAPAFMCSADAMPEDVARAKAAGFAGYWTKPIDIVAVTDTLCRLADRGDNPAP
ncbi:MAG: PAS domain S-box protein [Aquabacterium sp.]